MHQHRYELQRIFVSFYPIHTQNVERQIRIVSQISINIVIPELRDVGINITLLQRKCMPRFSSKRNCIKYIFNI